MELLKGKRGFGQNQCAGGKPCGEETICRLASVFFVLRIDWRN